MPPSKPKSFEKSLAYTHPQLCLEWSDDNPQGPENYSYGSRFIAIWECLSGHKWETRIKTRTLKKCGCPKCGIINVSKKISTPTDNKSFGHLYPELVLEWNLDNSKTPFDFKPGSNSKVLWKCKCGFEWKASIHNRTNRNSGCPSCSRSKVATARMTPKLGKSLNDIFPNLVKNEWSCKNNIGPQFFKPYSSKKTWWYCKKHKIHWQAKIKQRTLRFEGCPKCVMSSAERKISYYLDKKNIEYQTQYKFEDCLSRKGNKLRFDFALFLNGNLVLLEYHGDQHFIKPHYLTDDEFLECQIRDKIKWDYCIANKIPIVIITKYYFKEIETIINDIKETYL